MEDVFKFTSAAARVSTDKSTKCKGVTEHFQSNFSVIIIKKINSGLATIISQHNYTLLNFITQIKQIVRKPRDN